MQDDDDFDVDFPPAPAVTTVTANGTNSTRHPAAPRPIQSTCDPSVRSAIRTADELYDAKLHRVTESRDDANRHHVIASRDVSEENATNALRHGEDAGVESQSSEIHRVDASVSEVVLVERSVVERLNEPSKIIRAGHTTVEEVSVLELL